MNDLPDGEDSETKPNLEGSVDSPLEESEKPTLIPEPNSEFKAVLKSEVDFQQQKDKHSIAGYELVRELGRGGMGVVYQARDLRLKRPVALKMVLNGEYATEIEMRRFQLEAEAVAKLQHPQFVNIYDVGISEGRHFISLEYVEGGDLNNFIKQKPQNSKSAARIVELLARAMALAHHQGIVHRDLKPANILLTAQGEPKITDFGVAKIIDGTTGATRSGTVIGTPSYMAPEQAEGKRDAVGPAVDIYALGAILYHLTTGRPPFQSENAFDTLLQVIEDQPVVPRRLNNDIPIDLERIILKCLEKNPLHRYPNCEDLAKDLVRFQEGDSISIQSVNIMEKVTRALQRSKFDLDLRAWASMLYWIAAVVLMAEFVISLSSRGVYSEYWQIHLTIRTIQIVMLAGILWFYREKWWVSMGSVERQMLSIWGAFFFACWVTLPVGILMATPTQPFNGVTLYPQFAILSGLIYCVIGSNYWGKCYLFGAAFFIASLLMTIDLTFAPIQFGGLWAFCLLLIGRRLKLLQIELDSETDQR